MSTVVVQQPDGSGAVQVKQLLVGQVDGHRDWTSGLCGCCTNSNCMGVCMALFCLECTICKINPRIGECPCAHWIVPGALINMRTRVRTLGGIEGSMTRDCCAIGFCCPLAICQMERELNAMGL